MRCENFELLLIYYIMLFYLALIPELLTQSDCLLLYFGIFQGNSWNCFDFNHKINIP